MILILGGAYQGKLSFVKDRFQLKEQDIYICKDENIDFAKPCIYALEEFTYTCIVAGIDPVEILKSKRSQIQNTIFICQDIFCGIVPMERQQRLWRDATGKVCQYLAAESEEVYRVYCGLEQRLK